MSPINFNPNLGRNDSLSPKEIEEKVGERNAETRELTEKAYLVGDVPETAAKNAADNSAIQRETFQGKKARRDAATWYNAQSNDGTCEEDG